MHVFVLIGRHTAPQTPDACPSQASLDKRRQVLQDGYYFKCNCSLCTQQESAHTH